MAHEFVQGVRVEGSDKSWHGLETTVTAEEAKNLAGLLKTIGISSVRSLACFGIRLDDEGNVAEMLPTDQIALYDESNVHLGTHGAETYNIHQAFDALNPFFEVVETMDGRFTFDFGSRLRGGKVITFNFVCTDDITIVGEKHKNFINVSTSFDGSLPTAAGGTTIREVCMNTVNYSNSLSTTKKFKIKHRRELPSSDDMRRQVEQVLSQFDGYKALAEQLASFRISKDAAKDWLKAQLFTSKEVEAKTSTGEVIKVMSEPSTRLSNRIDLLIKSYETTLNETGNESSAWTMWNALTRFSDHEGTIRMTEGRKQEGSSEEMIRLENNLYGNSATFKTNELNALRELIAA